MPLETAHWLTLDAPERLAELGKLDAPARDQLLRADIGDISTAEIQEWLRVAQLWDNPSTRQWAEVEAQALMH
jgi:hypothetical protein